MWFELRSKLRFKGRAVLERGKISSEDLPLSERARFLIQRYELSRFFEEWSQDTLREVLGVLDLLDRFPVDRRGIQSVLDVGSKNWKYLGALLSWLSSDVSKLTGVELDPYQLYWSGTTRYQVAQSQIQICQKRFPKVSLSYLGQDFRRWNKPQDLLFCLFPFMHLSTHRAWQLPKSLFDPKGFVESLERNLKPHGTLILIQQGKWEKDAWDEIQPRCAPLLQRQWEEEVQGSLHPSSHPLYLRMFTRMDF